jgi:hypothetical protein
MVNYFLGGKPVTREDYISHKLRYLVDRALAKWNQRSK